MSVPQHADVVVVGGGIMGTSVAWHLARRAAGRVVLLRQHYTNLPEAILARESLKVFQDWDGIVGGDCGYVPWGLVVTVDQSSAVAHNVELLAENVAFQRGLGTETEVISADELKALQPWATVDDIQTAAYETRSGYADSVAATRSMADAAERAGVEIVEGVRTLSIRSDGTRVTGVVTDAGTIETGAVILAAGPWSVPLAASAGVALPVEALRVQVAIVHRPRDLAEAPFVFLDMAVGFFTRPWGPGRSLIGVAGGDQHDAVDPEDFVQGNDVSYPGVAKAAAARRIPAMARASYLHGHAGLYDMTPDTHPIIGQVGPEGLYTACGFSGAGFKKGPAVGQALAETMLDGASTLVDLTPFRLSRFDEPGWDRPWSDTEYLFTSDFGHKL